LKLRAGILIPALLVLLWGPLKGLRAAELRAPSASVARSASSAAAAALLEAPAGPSESRELILTWVNFLVLVAALVYLLRRPLADFFGDRRDTIREGLEKGRQALRASDAKLAEVELKIGSLEQEIAAFRTTAERDMQAEAARLTEAAEREAERILEFAQAQIVAAGRAAQADLRRYAAGQAVELAETLIRQRLDGPGRHALVSRFVGELKGAGTEN